MEIDDPGEGSSSQDPPFGPTTARRGSNVLQATELAKIRKQYSNASTAAQSSPAIRRVQAPAPGSLAYLVYQIKKLWRNQISVVVDHEDCRDHLGMYAPLVFLFVESVLCLLPATCGCMEKPCRLLRHSLFVRRTVFPRVCICRYPVRFSNCTINIITHLISSQVTSSLCGETCQFWSLA